MEAEIGGSQPIRPESTGAPSKDLLGWAPQLGAEVEVGLGPA